MTRPSKLFSHPRERGIGLDPLGTHAPARRQALRRHRGSRPVGEAAQEALGTVACRRLPLSVQVRSTSGEITLGIGVPVFAAEIQQSHSVLTALVRGLVETVNLRQKSIASESPSRQSMAAQPRSSAAQRAWGLGGLS